MTSILLFMHAALPSGLERSYFTYSLQALTLRSTIFLSLLITFQGHLFKPSLPHKTVLVGTNSFLAVLDSNVITSRITISKSFTIKPSTSPDHHISWLLLLKLSGHTPPRSGNYATKPKTTLILPLALTLISNRDDYVKLPLFMTNVMMLVLLEMTTSFMSPSLTIKH
jgi:hypothetical protein